MPIIFEMVVGIYQFMKLFAEVCFLANNNTNLALASDAKAERHLLELRGPIRSRDSKMSSLKIRNWKSRRDATAGV